MLLQNSTVTKILAFDGILCQADLNSNQRVKLLCFFTLPITFDMRKSFCYSINILVFCIWLWFFSITGQVKMFVSLTSRERKKTGK